MKRNEVMTDIDIDDRNDDRNDDGNTYVDDGKIREDMTEDVLTVTLPSLCFIFLLRSTLSSSFIYALKLIYPTFVFVYIYVYMHINIFFLFNSDTYVFICVLPFICIRDSREVTSAGGDMVSASKLMRANERREQSE